MLKTEIEIQQHTALVRLSIDSITIDSDHRLAEANELLVVIVAQRKKDEAAIIELSGIDDIKTSLAKARAKVKRVTDAYDQMREAIEKKMAKYIYERKKAREAYDASVQDIHLRDKNRALNKAEVLRAQGKTMEAATMEAMANLPVPVIPNAKLALEGTAEYQDYDIEITDLMAFVKGIAAGTIPISGVVMKKPTDMVKVTESVVKVFAREAGGDLNWPGIKVTPKTKFRVSERD